MDTTDAGSPTFSSESKYKRGASHAIRFAQSLVASRINLSHIFVSLLRNFYLCSNIQKLEQKFKVEFLEEAVEFLESLEEKAREKIIYNIRKAQITNDKELFKKLTGEIWEFRTMFKRTYFRLFAFWDKSDNKNTVVISTHGLIKKTGKTPARELEKAERMRVIYFEFKGKKK